MKCRKVIDKSREEEVVIYVKEDSEAARNIERYVLSLETELVGFHDSSIIPINQNEVACFIVEQGKVYALVGKERLRMKRRLYEIEEFLDSRFVKINQSCVVNVSEILKFDASIMGTLTVTLKNGYRDYVSRRRMSEVKRRIGF